VRSGGSAFACNQSEGRSQPKLAQAVPSTYALAKFSALRRTAFARNQSEGRSQPKLARAVSSAYALAKFSALRRISLRMQPERRLVSRVGIEPTTRRLRVGSKKRKHQKS